MNKAEMFIKAQLNWSKWPAECYQTSDKCKIFSHWLMTGDFREHWKTTQSVVIKLCWWHCPRGIVSDSHQALDDWLIPHYMVQHGIKRRYSRATWWTNHNLLSVGGGYLSLTVFPPIWNPFTPPIMCHNLKLFCQKLHNATCTWNLNSLSILILLPLPQRLNINLAFLCF